MVDDNIAAMGAFDATLAGTREPKRIWRALHSLCDELIGVKLFTVMQLDWANRLSARTYTSHRKAYPVSGTKPINGGAWFDIVHLEKRAFVANTIKEIATVFPDHELIWSLGCGSVINLPVFVGGKLLGTVNLLHEEHFYSEARVRASEQLNLPAKAAFLAASCRRERPTSA